MKVITFIISYSFFTWMMFSESNNMPIPKLDNEFFLERVYFFQSHDSDNELDSDEQSNFQNWQKGGVHLGADFLVLYREIFSDSGIYDQERIILQKDVVEIESLFDGRLLKIVSRYKSSPVIYLYCKEGFDYQLISSILLNSDKP